MSSMASRKSCSRCKHVQCTCRGPGPMEEDDPSDQPPSNRSLAPDTDPVCFPPTSCLPSFTFLGPVCA
jgi:hypothetical protein